MVGRFRAQNHTGGAVLGDTGREGRRVKKGGERDGGRDGREGGRKGEREGVREQGTEGGRHGGGM